jgi:ribosome-associated protein
MQKYIELNAFIKVKNLANTGGLAKLLIRSGAVLVNSEIETRNKRKLVAGDKVSASGKTFVVEEKVLLMG